MRGDGVAAFGHAAGIKVGRFFGAHDFSARSLPGVGKRKALWVIRRGDDPGVPAALNGSVVHRAGHYRRAADAQCGRSIGLNLHPIADVDLADAIHYQHCGGCRRRTQHYALAEHFARQVRRRIGLRSLAEPKDAILHVRQLVNKFLRRALVAEETNVVVGFSSLVASQVDVEHVVLAQGAGEFLGRYHQAVCFAGGRRKPIEMLRSLQRRRNPRHGRPRVIAALQMFAGVHHQSRSYVFAGHDHLHAAQVAPLLAHGFQDVRLAIEPLEGGRVFHGANDLVFISHLHALRGSLTDVDVVILRVDRRRPRFLTGDDVGVVRDCLRRYDPGAIDVRPIGH